LANDQVLVDYIADRLVSLGDSVPDQIDGFRMGEKGNPFIDDRIYDFKNYPAQLYAKPGDKAPNRAALAKWGAWINAFGAKEGTFYIQGTSAMANTIKILPSIDQLGLNIKLVYVSSPQLFALQEKSYQNRIVTPSDKMNSTLITTSGKKLLPEFTFNSMTLEYTMSPDWDIEWRTGGTLEEVLEEAHLSTEWIFDGIKKFCEDRELRMNKLKESFNF
jgi:hypothetical protein